jgi:hypothetical protein
MKDAHGTNGTGQDRTGQLSRGQRRVRRDRTGHTPLGVSRCPGNDAVHSSDFNLALRFLDRHVEEQVLALV